MAEEFNPYHVWLSIRPEEQPPNHYRLLGLPIFETNADVIDNAADRQMAHLRTIQVGKHGELSQRLLNEVAAARICLLDPKKRAAYDQQLWAKLPATPVATLPASGSAIQRQPPRRPGPLPTVAPAPAPSVPVAAALPQATNDWDDLLGDPAAKRASRSAGKSAGANSVRAGAAKRAANNRNMSIGIAAAVLLIAAAGIGWFALNGSSSEGTLVFDWPSDEKADATVTVDDVPLPAPASGAWEYHGPAGSHHIVALRPAYKIDASVALAAGQKQTAATDWKPKAVLALNWPLSQRGGAELKIDGRTHAVTQHDPLELAVEPGPHVVQITRSGSAPIVHSATVAPDGRAQVAIAPQPRTSKLVFDWPADQRKDAELVIDGHSQTIAAGSAGAPIELTLDPGRHVVRITRTGFEAFKRTVDLVAGEGETVKPTWTPAETVASDPAETQAPVETPTEQPAKKFPIPPAAEQEKVAKQLADLYKSTHSGSKDPAKAQELYDLAARPGISPAERYVLLAKGAELAAAAGNVNLSLQGVDSLDAEFEIDALEARQKLLDKFVNAGKPEQVDAAIPIAEQFMDQSVAADRFALAIEFSMTASRAATKSKTPTRKEIDERLSRRRHEIHTLEPFFAAAKTARETLAKNPADAESNLNVGRWLCFYKGDWSAGLPLLAKGSDEKLKSLAEQQLKAPTDAEQQAHLADAWWELSSKESGIARDSIRIHAGEIYQAAMPNLASALRKAAIEKRLAEIADLKPVVGTTAAIVTTATGKTAGATKFPLNQWVDVLRLVDTTKNAVAGTWSRHGAIIAVEAGETARIAIPVEIEGGYDLEADFTRTSGGDDVAAILPIRGHSCMATLSGFSGKASGLMNLAGRDASDPNNPTSVRPGELDNGHRYRLSIRVRILAEDRASVDVWLDGKPYLPHWEGNPASLSASKYWPMPNPKCLGLGAHKSEVTFHAAHLRMVSGHASAEASISEAASPQATLPTDASGKPTTAAAFPLNQWVDVLRLVDATENLVQGTWSRHGAQVATEICDASRIAIPLEVEGGYDFEVDFVRASGDEDVVAMFSVDSHPCMVTLSAMHGDVSGLMDLDGRHATDNAIARRPGKLQNGRRYRLLVGVRIISDDRASIDVSLDGKPYLPHWEGNPASLSLDSYWSLPGNKGLGLGAQHSEVAFDSARLRMVSGHASAEPVATLEPRPDNPTILLARFGAGDAWFDVTGRVRKAVAHGETINSSPPFFNFDPANGVKKELQITYEKAGKKRSITIDEGQEWSKDDYEKLAP
jgi:hypothetical protein